MTLLLLCFLPEFYSGIANTMDLPEKLLPRISSRMGIQRLCFGPYNYLQLQEIILSRLRGIDAFEKQAIEFASRKVSPISIHFITFLTSAFAIPLNLIHEKGLHWYLLAFEFRLQLFQEMLAVHWRYVDELQSLQIIVVKDYHHFLILQPQARHTLAVWFLWSTVIH